jgi:FkbM family methyltransferase
VFDLLLLNTKSLDNILCFNYGLSDKAAEVIFKENKTNIGSSFIANLENSNYDKDQYKIVQVRALDDEALKCKVSLIKVDIEGHEIRFLKGASNTIKKDKPVILFEEAVINDRGSSEVIEYLGKLDYEFYILVENFYFGDTKIKRLLRFALQDVFGIKVKIVKVRKFRKRFYHLIIALPK